jgi:uncharacterized membrane protein
MQGRMHAGPVVPAQPLKHRVPGFTDRCEALTVQPLHLQRAEQVLSACVIPAIALAAHRGGNAVIIEKPGAVLAGILTAAIAMEQQLALDHRMHARSINSPEISGLVSRNLTTANLRGVQIILEFTASG